jgi:hypothetical protein
MPEAINRIAADICANYCFAPKEYVSLSTGSEKEEIVEAIVSSRGYWNAWKTRNISHF